MKKDTGTVAVIGMVHGGHLIEDISVRVPYGSKVSIPPDLALRSKELWRAINQRLILKVSANFPVDNIHATFPRPQPSLEAAPDLDRVKLEAQIHSLNEKMRGVQEENQKLRNEHSTKLDTILAALRDGARAPMAPTNVPANATPTQSVSKATKVDDSAPVFIPSQIKSDTAEAHIDVQGTSAKSEVSSTKEKLRKMRKKNVDNS